MRQVLSDELDINRHRVEYAEAHSTHPYISFASYDAYIKHCRDKSSWGGTTQLIAHHQLFNHLVDITVWVAMDRHFDTLEITQPDRYNRETPSKATI